MSKLKNAPLVEVIFELRWVIGVNDKEELAKCQYLHGDLYAQIKDEYKERESLVAQGIPMEFYLNNPSHRFRVAKDDYPLIQVGPGLLTVNTVDSKYIWEEYEVQVKNAIAKFFDVYVFDPAKEITLTLHYFDFLEFAFEKNDVYDYLSKNLNLSIQQNFYKNKNNPNNFNLGFFYTTDLGSLSIQITKGKNLQQIDGIIMQTTIVSKRIKPSKDLIHNWLNESHDFCSQLFKDMTKGNLYESFKSNNK